jgi:outer membrane protein assembly factor BamB
VIAAILLALARLGVKALVPGFAGFALGMQWALGAAAAVLLWWLLFSRARWLDRVTGVVLMISGLAAAWFLKHESMGPAWFAAYAIPTLCIAFVAWAVATRRLADGPRRATMAATIVLACGVWTLVRMEGISGDHVISFDWRWSASAEERLLAISPTATDRATAVPTTSTTTARTPPATPSVPEPADRPAVAEAGATPAEGAEWPGFRGPERDGISRGVRIETNWSASPPVALWRRPIGPGWSSFAVAGDRLYTQEQRGEDEVVACYSTATGEPVWTHRDAARFFEANGGAGPRGTPTVSGGRVYTFGATGIVNALDAGNGAVVWSRNAASDTGAPVPDWGFSSSPLVAGDAVIVAAGGRLAAYDAVTGNPRWVARTGGVSYSSPHLVTIGGATQVLLLGGAGATGFAPADGTQLWQHPSQGFPIVQPALTAEGDVLIAGDTGTRRIEVAHGAGGWTAEERWSSNGLKPYFNDFVVHRGHAYGFDVRILACIDLADGTRKWKGGRYGSGQLVLLPDQDLLLVLSDEGELALINATPDRFTEVARFKAIEGKTWNHPVVVGNLLLVRNGEEMAAFRLPAAGR